MTDIFEIRTEFTYFDDPFGAACREIKRVRVENERLEAFIADRIHDATREEMLMAIGPTNG